MRIAIGIFAHNEEAQIESTLESLSRQDLLKGGTPGLSIQICVLANGCVDATVARSRKACERLFAQREEVRASIAVISSPGKSNAWNEYVHRFSVPIVDYLVFMDGDIQFLGLETLTQLVQCLETTPEANVAVDTILKDIVFSSDRTPFDVISLKTSELSRAGDPKIAGSLYVLRAEVARRIWLPVGLLVEDGFLKALILTEGFTEAENTRKIARAEGAAHTFVAEKKIGAVYRHEKRLTTGTAQNIILFRFLRKAAQEKPAHVGEVIRRLNETDPDWVCRLTKSEVAKRGWRVLPFQMVLLPFRQLGFFSGGVFARYLVVCMLRSVFNALALCGAYIDLRRGRLCW